MKNIILISLLLALSVVDVIVAELEVDLLKEFEIENLKHEENNVDHKSGKKWWENIRSLYNTVASTLDLGDKNDQSLRFYRLNSPLFKQIILPDTFVHEEGLQNLTIDIVFRHNGNIKGQLCLLELSTLGLRHNSALSICLMSEKAVTYLEQGRSTQNLRGISKEVNVYDGKWHRLQLDFKMMRDKDPWFHRKAITLYLDCRLIAENVLNDLIPFQTAQQNATILKNNLFGSFSDFDVMVMRMKGNYMQASCKQI